MNILDVFFSSVLPGYKTYLAAAGLIGLGVYEFSQGNVSEAVKDVMLGVAAIGGRSAIASKS